jgi:hypothetical protein
MNTIMIYLPIVILTWTCGLKIVGSKTRCWRWEDERDSDYIYEGALAFLQQNIDY